MQKQFWIHESDQAALIVKNWNENLTGKGTSGLDMNNVHFLLNRGRH